MWVKVRSAADAFAVSWITPMLGLAKVYWLDLMTMPTFFASEFWRP